MSRRSRRKKLKRLEELRKQHETQPETEEKPEIQEEPKEEEKKPEISAPVEKEKVTGIKDFYNKKYKLLLIIPFALLLIAIIQIGVQTATTGDFINKGVSLKGGITINIPTQTEIDLVELQDHLSGEFSDLDINVRSLKSTGNFVGILIEADAQEENIESFVSEIEQKTGISRKEYSIESMGSSLGESFFRETFIAILVAFVFMGIVVFIYFRTFIPSLAVILAALSDMIITVSITNILGLKISTAGIAAFIMLIGYSVDTDILLSTKILKRKEGTVFDRVLSAMKTGVTMTATTIAAVTIGLIFSESAVLHQIMIIILIGLLVDLINTWIQNVGILRWYVDSKGIK